MVGKDNNLGEIGENAKITKDQVIDAFVKKFSSKEPRLTNNEIEIDGNISESAKEATIRAKSSSKVFTGSVKVAFTVKKINIVDLVKAVEGNKKPSLTVEVFHTNVIIREFVKKYGGNSGLKFEDLHYEEYKPLKHYIYIFAKPDNKRFIGKIKVRIDV